MHVPQCCESNYQSLSESSSILCFKRWGGEGLIHSFKLVEVTVILSASVEITRKKLEDEQEKKMQTPSSIRVRKSTVVITSQFKGYQMQ